MGGNDTSSDPPTNFNASFMTYVTAAVVFLVFILALFFFCLAAEIYRRKKNKRIIPTIIRPTRVFRKDNHYDKSPVLHSTYEEDAISVAGDVPGAGGVSNLAYEHVEERKVPHPEIRPISFEISCAKAVPDPSEGHLEIAPEAPSISDPEYDFLQDDGYLRPDCNPDRLVSVIPIPEQSPVPQSLPAIVGPLPSPNLSGAPDQPIFQSINCTNTCPTPSDSHLISIPADQEVEFDNPVYATVPEEYNQPIYTVVPGENDSPDNTMDAWTIIDSVSSLTIPENSYNLYDNNRQNGLGLHRGHSEAESEDGTFLTIEDVVHSYERIPCRLGSEGAQAVVASESSKANEARQPSPSLASVLYDTAEADQASDIDCEDHVYEAVPETGPHPIITSPSHELEIQTGPHDSVIYENCSLPSTTLPRDYGSANSHYINVQQEEPPSYLPMDGTMKKRKGSDHSGGHEDYLPMEGLPVFDGDLQVSSELYSYAHLPGQSNKDIYEMEDNQIYSVANEGMVYPSVVFSGSANDNSTEIVSDDYVTEEYVSHDIDGSASQEDDVEYEVINAGIDSAASGASGEHYLTMSPSGSLRQDNEGSVTRRSLSLNNLLDVPEYYNESEANSTALVHWGSMNDVRDKQLTLQLDSVRPPTPSPKTLSRTFTGNFSVDDDCAVYGAWSNSDFVIELESEA